MIFLINGKARSGKDTIADYIVKVTGAKKLWFAKPLKDMGQKYFYLIEDECYDNKTEISRRVLQGLGMAFRGEVDPCYWVNFVVKQIGEFVAQGNKHFVISDCRFKNEIIELCAAYDHKNFVSVINNLDKDVWKDYQLEYYGKTLCDGNVIPDNFLDASLPQIGCTTVKVTRNDCPDIEYNAGHASENDLNDFSFECLIENNGTLNDLYRMVDGLIVNTIGE